MTLVGIGTKINLRGLTKGWIKLGIKPGDCVMVHSSMRKIGEIVDLNDVRVDKTEAARIVIESLQSCIGEGGTMVSPGLSGTQPWLTADNPVWTRDKEITRFTIPDVFRQMENTRRSLHPTHSICANGRLAEAITADHLDSSTPCGLGSPYAKLVQYNSKILLIGVDLHSCTFIHHLEEKYNAPGHMREGTAVSISIEELGKREFRYHLVSGMEGYRRRDFNRFIPFLLEAGCLVKESIGDAQCFLLTDLHLMDRIAAEQFSKDPSFLILND